MSEESNMSLCDEQTLYGNRLLEVANGGKVN